MCVGATLSTVAMWRLVDPTSGARKLQQQPRPHTKGALCLPLKLPIWLALLAFLVSGGGGGGDDGESRGDCGGRARAPAQSPTTVDVAFSSKCAIEAQLRVARRPPSLRWPENREQSSPCVFPHPSQRTRATRVRLFDIIELANFSYRICCPHYTGIPHTTDNSAAPPISHLILHTKITFITKHSP